MYKEADRLNSNFIFLKHIGADNADNKYFLDVDSEYKEQLTEHLLKTDN
jgi:hypothetical protein